MVRDASDPVLQSDWSSLDPSSRRAPAVADTFTIYGGPSRYPEGRFEDAGGSASWNGWTSVDLTDFPPHWHVDTFNAQNLNAHGAGNHAMWSGQSAADQPEWLSPPGYGNSWFDVLIYESAPLADPSAPQVVDLDFYFNHDVEPEWDFFRVLYDSAGQWVEAYSVDGANVDSLGSFAAPGVHYAEVGTRPIQYVGNDYGGEFGDRIRIRFVVDSDGAWSDEDGLFDSAAGAVQIDDVTIVTSEGTFTEDFEGPGPYLLRTERMPFAGDFADIYPGFRDIDPCRENRSPLAGFLDYAQVVRNGPGADGSISTGGSTSPGINYGVPGSWVTNYTGGLSYGLVPLCNCIESPEIAWDLPGTEDDDPGLVGAMIRFTTWFHLPLDNGMFFYWQVRSASAGSMFGGWRDDNWFNYGGAATWSNYEFDVSRHIAPDPERVQVRLCARDLAEAFGLPGIAGTPSPLFDNVRVQKYRAGGPRITAYWYHLPGDGFPASGSIDVSSPAARDALDVPFDMGMDRNSGDLFIVPGDSTVVTCETLLPETSLQDLRMVWALKTNSLFEDALREPPSGTRDVNVAAGPAGTVWTGEVLATNIPRPPDWSPMFSFDLPDADFLYPGDVLQYYFRATDSDGRISTLPLDLDGFGDFDGIFPGYGTIHALPTVKDTSGAQPPILVLDDIKFFPHASALEQSLIELGLVEGIDYDMYRRRCVGVSPGSDGIGSSGGHGASLPQISGYSTILYFSRNRGPWLLGAGPGETWWTKSDDIALLEAWHRLGGRRNMAFFGDRLAESLTMFSSGLAFLSNTMGVQYVASDVIPYLGGNRTPEVQPEYPGFSTPLFLNFWCQPGTSGTSPHNHVEPAAGATRGHGFLIGTPGEAVDGAAASVVFPNPYPGVFGYDVTFPYSISWMYPAPQRPVALSGRTLLLQELLLLFEENPGSPPVVSAPELATLALSVSPNPFNPRTEIRFDVASGTQGEIKVFTIRGELVRTVHRGPFETTRFEWDGTDQRGAPVASGVYLVRATAEGKSQYAKVAVIR